MLLCKEEGSGNVQEATHPVDQVMGRKQRTRRMRASSSLASSTAAFHSRTLLGTRSSARRSTRAFAASSVSSLAACASYANQIEALWTRMYL